MSKPKKTRVRQCWATAVTGVASVAVASAYGASLLPLNEPKTMSYDVIETAAIVEAPSTIGMSEGSDLYWLAADPLTQLQLAETLDQMQALGVQTVRVGIPWGLVEAGLPGVYNWTVVDRIINAADARGMGVLGVVTTSPLRYGLFPPGGVHPTSPAQFAAYLAAFSNFTSAAANRYKGKVGAYEIWNEPNYIQFWNPVDAAAYTQLLKAGYTAIKGDPNNPNDGVDEAALVIGGVVGATQTTPFTLNPVTFVQQMYAAGAHDFFDALSFHPYGNLPFTDRDANTTLLTPIEQLEAIRAVMDANGDPSLKIWISEYGVSTDGWTTPEEKQAAWDKQEAYLENILRAWQNVNGAGPIFVYTTRDQLTGAPGAEANFGIFETNWTPKDAAALIERIIAELNAPPTPGNPPTNPLAALFQQLSMAFNNAFSFLPNLFSGIFNFGSLFSAIGNFFGSIFGVPAATAAAAAPPNENFALMADETDAGDASRVAEVDSAAAESEGANADDGVTETDDVAEADVLPTGDEVEPTVEEVEPVVVETTTQAVPAELDVDADLESSKLETDNDTTTADELKNDELKTDELKNDDDVTTDVDVKTADDKPANATVTNGSVTTTKVNDGAPANKPDPDNDGAGSDDGGDSGGGEG